MPFDPSILPRLALLVPVLFMITGTAGDPDLWGHVRFGRDILASGSIRMPDPYSFTSDRTWVNHEWLTEVASGAAYNAAGATGLILLRLSFLAAVFTIVARRLRHVEPPLARDLLLVFAMAGTHAIGETVRPQLFSLLAFAWLLRCVSAYPTQGLSALWSMPILMILWANAHGGWLVGLGAFGVWTVATIATSSGMPAVTGNERRRHRAALAALLAAAACATAVNPYGIGLWQFLADTVRFTRADISEWQPLHTASAGRIALWAVAAVMVGAGALLRRVSVPSFALAALLAYASLRVRRIDGFFILSAVMLAGPPLAAALSRAAPPAAAVRPSLLPLRWRGATVAGVIALLLVDGMLRPGGRFGCIDTSDPRLADPEAAAVLRANPVEGRMLTWFDWGEYAIWHFSPAVQVSMDGRRETVYSAEMIQAHLDFYFARDDLALLDRLRPDLIWLPVRLPVVPRLQQTGWEPLFAGERSVVLAPPGAPAQTLPRPAAAGPADYCFPGP